MTLPILLAFISGGLLSLIGIVFLIVYAWDFTHRYGIKRALVLLLYIVIVVSLVILYVSLWFIIPWVIGIATLVTGVTVAYIISEIDF